MKVIHILYFNLFSVFILFSQGLSPFQEVKESVDKVLYSAPKEAKKQVYLLKKTAKTREDIITAYQYLGNMHNLTGNADSARYYFQKELIISKKYFLNTKRYYQAVIDYVNWGKNYVDGNVLMTELTQALLTINESANPQEKGVMYMLMGDLQLRENHLDKANDYFDKSFNLITGNNVVPDYFLRKSEVALKRRDYSSAKENLLKGLDSFEEKEIYEYSLYLNKLGYVFLLLEDVENSSQHLYESLHYQKKHGFHNLSSSTYLNLYYLSKIQKNERLEKFNLDKALELNQGDIYILKDIYLAYKDYYSKQGDFFNENESLAKFNQINDSIFNIEKAKLGTDLESRFRLRENKKELALKEKIIQKETRIKTLYLVSFIILFFLLIVLMIVYYHKTKTQKKLRDNQNLLHEEQLKATLERQKSEIIKEKIKAKFEEREKISLELHDGIANEIGALKVAITSEELFDKKNINSIVDKIDNLYNEVRDLSHELNPERILDIEFAQLVNSLCLMVEKKGISVIKNVLISKKVNTLEDSVLLSIYRILQETINNIVKHASATQVQLDIIELESELLLQIKDNGVGFSKNNSTGIGLKNIEKRVELLKGEFEINSSREGVLLEIKLPL